ncbi:MAG: cyclic nucleotide-binding/CBS domain-containing protein [Promethearchaeota archaeon]
MSLKEYYIRDLVINDEYGIIDSNASIQDAAKKMKELGVPDLVVVKGEEQKVLGIIADFDIVQNVVAEGTNTKTEKVISAMYKIKPVTLDTPVTEAFTRMRDLNANVVPVVENEKLVGVATIHDCWSYIPDQTVDEIGLIPVKNTKAIEFWFGSVCAIIGFTLGILLPLSGIFGFFTGKYSDLLSLLGMGPMGEDPTLIFSLFDVRGPGLLMPYYILRDPIWIVIDIFSILMLVSGIVGLFSIIYTGFSDTRNLETGWKIRTIMPGLAVFFMAFEWILFSIAFTTTTQPIIAIDPIGLTLSIISMILFLLAIYRDYIFRGIEATDVKTSEVSS